MKELTKGVDYAFSAIGAASGLDQAVRMCAYGGVATLVGVPSTGATLGVDLYRNVFGPKVSIAVTHGGDTIPQEDFPFLAQAALDGQARPRAVRVADAAARRGARKRSAVGPERRDPRP